MLASHMNHGDINTMAQSNQTPNRNSKMSSYLNQTDSDDDDNQPPALSDYALALLQKDKESQIPKQTADQGPQQHQNRHLPKRVNFHYDTKRKNEHFITINNNNNTAHTNQSEYETIFTKNVHGDLNSIASSSPNEKTQKTPSNKFASSHNSSFNSDNSNARSKSAIRRNRMLGSLGPPKRASVKLEDPPLSSQPTNTIANEEETMKENDVLMRESITSSNPNLPQHFKNHTSPPKTRFDFEGLNPYQYTKKYNLPPSDLPKLVKMYFEQQKNDTRDSLNNNSPARLKDALYTKIEKDMHHQDPRSPYKPDPRQKLFKVDKEQKASSQRNEYQGSQDKISVYSDKENQDPNGNNILNSIERPFKVQRRPLVPLSESNQSQQQNRLSQTSLKSAIERIPKSYQEHHIQQIEPLKAPDSSTKSNSRIISINGKQYEKLELLGKGGSSKVFKVKSMSNKVYAIKKISFDEFDEASIKGFKGEIDLLSKLRDQERVVRLIDHCLGQGSLLLIMECGDIDLSHVLAKRLDVPLDVEFVRFHANEILKCVKAVHDAGIVHSDLKPANFLFVKGMLKIIDFGIANAVPEHTMNIYRENQIGTPNYMAPEALIDNNQHLADSTQHHKSTWKVGKPSDIWSCGCIIYQMIYGRPPYGGYQGSQRLLAIMNPDVKIAYPEKGLGSVKVPGTAIETIEACLHRDPNKRWTAQEILDGPFLKPRVVSEQFINDLVKNAITYGVSKSSINDEELRTLADDVWRRVSQLSL
ncbi:unnamed protein product [Wickerhamomyces anomalus]